MAKKKIVNVGESQPGSEACQEGVVADSAESLISRLEQSILAISHGHREVDLAVLDTMKSIERIKSLVKFINKALEG